MAGYIVPLTDGVRRDIGDVIRSRLPGDEEVTITVKEIQPGPPTDEMEVTITGNNFTAIASVAKQLQSDLSDMDGIINLTSDLSDARDEVVVNINTEEAAQLGLSTTSVAQQVNRYIVG